MTPSHLIHRCLIVLAMLVGFSESAYAYLDPGTGSIILQGLIAGIALGLSTIKFWWGKVSGFFSWNKEAKEERETPNTED
jgi:hypothetical protein